jgi:hypothetical protein
MSLLKRKFGATQPGQAALSGDPLVMSDRVGSGQRIRVGLTGLAAIFLLVLIAAAGLRPGQSRAAQETTGDPLAVLGVAPGASAERESLLPASARPAAPVAAQRPTSG